MAVDSRLIRQTNPKRRGDNVEDAKNACHDENADEAPQERVFPFLSPLFAPCVQYELSGSPQEIREREREQKPYKRVDDKGNDTRDELGEILHIDIVYPVRSPRPRFVCIA